MKRKSIHVTSVHSPFDARINQRECRSLVDAGYDVVLIAPHTRDDTVDGIRIRAAPPQSGRWSRVLRSPWDILETAKSERGDVYHLHDPELLPIGLALAASGARVIYDVHEDVPRDIMTKEYLPRPVRAAVSAASTVVEPAFVRAFAGVVAATPTIAARFPREKTVTVQNFPRMESFPGGDRSRAVGSRRFVYVGSVTAIRGGLQMLEALGRVDPVSPPSLTLAGHITPPAFAESMRAHPAWPLVDYRGWCNPEELPELFADALAGLVLLHPTQTYRDSYPGKMFEYMAAGMPVIASDFPLWREIVESSGAGLLVDPMDPAAISAAMRWMLANPAEAAAMGSRGREAVRTRFNWGLEESKLLGLYERLLDPVPA